MPEENSSCFVCGNSNASVENLTEISKTPYLSIFLQISGLKTIEDSDVSCTNCLVELSNCHQFQLKCLRSSAILTRKGSLTFFHNATPGTSDPEPPTTTKGNLKTEPYCDDDSTTFPAQCLPEGLVEPESKNREFSCDTCGASIHGFSKYAKHQLAHGEKPTFECGICGVAMRFKKNMAEHMQGHAKSWHRCHLCSQSFRTNSVLARHLTFHENRRRFLCPHCPLRFNLSSSRNFHVDSVHLKKAKFTCESCPATFYHKRGWLYHLKAVHGNGGKDLACGTCDQRFYFKTDLRQHVRRKHPKWSETVDGDSLWESELGDTI